MSHARVEEISDSDSDPEIMDIDDLTLPSSSRDAIVPVAPKPNPTLMDPSKVPSHSPPPGAHPSAAQGGPPPEILAASKQWAILYPIYFDAGATRDQGRRISKELAVKNPLALSIAEALKMRNLVSMFEPLKRHSSDWTNPGRVRVQLKDEDGNWVAKGINNKHHLMIVVAEHLRKNPTKPEDPLKLPFRGLPVPEGIPPAPAVPRGWRINEIVPLHSSAQTGGGVSENMLKELQAAMTGQEMPPDPPEPTPKKAKKEKGKKKK